jgi:PAS domain S-box-containing protein
MNSEIESKSRINMVLINKNTGFGKTVLTVLFLVPAMVMAIAAMPLFAAFSKANKRALYYEAVVDNMATPILIVDKDGVIVLANNSAEKLFQGHGDSQPVSLEGSNVRHLLAEPGEGVDGGAQFMQDAARVNVDDKELPAIMLRGSGERFQVYVGVRKLQGPSDGDVYVAAIEERSQRRLQLADLLDEAVIADVESPPKPSEGGGGGGGTTSRGLELLNLPKTVEIPQEPASRLFSPEKVDVRQSLPLEN